MHDRGFPDLPSLAGSSALPRRLLALLLTVVLAAGAVVSPGRAAAAGNASRAAGFVEDAQNRDGGFGLRQGRKSDPETSLWASVALLAAGKNPKDEWLKGGRSADEYLIAHRSSYRSIGDLGLLALVRSSGKLSVTQYGDPAATLRSRLSKDVARTDPEGTALAIFGLLADGSSASTKAASAAGQALLDTVTSDGAWGPSGNADTSSTALVLQALVATGQAKQGDAPVTSGVAYLQAAQGNDGGLLKDTRLDKGVYKSSVPATAFAIQALQALGLPTLRTPTGKTLRQGLTDYQQRASGGLTSTGAYDERTKPSVLDTGQAFAAFNGKTFDLPVVTSKTGGPANERRKQREAKEQAKAKDEDAKPSTGPWPATSSSSTSPPSASDPRRSSSGSGT
ncbi:prenyltransferase/squalene oxidase repeat-containing protein, partial [Patulibacter sp. NPDC049589]|uniref:prenyltransferase/squalene oxidase repeat-containing protein n=1 Tax=Patulibacter sp. NPDC049589 TaxID=3154731 RepID=UPI0034244794